MQQPRRARAGVPPSSVAKRCGDLFRQFREAAGLTREDLAKQILYSRETIKKFEYGERIPSAAAVNALADALELGSEQRAALHADAQRASEGTPEAWTPSRVPAPPLVGRTHEIGLIEQHLAGAGPPVLVFAGEPGIGKSRLLDEAERLATEKGWRVLRGGCTRRSGQEPYAPLVGALARYLTERSPAQQRRDLQGCAWLVRLLPELIESRLVPAPSWTLPPEQERRLMFGAVGRLLANIAGPAGTLLLLDDLQWAGIDALDLLADLMQLPAQRPLRAIAAYRDTEVRPADPLAVVLADLAGRGLAAHHPLGPLAAEEARALADKLLTEALEQDDAALAARARRAERLADRTGGVPFFLVSCALASRTVAAEDVAGAQMQVPWNVAVSIQQRVAVLPEAARYLLGAAAVVGRIVPRTILLAIAAQAEWSRRELPLGLEAACRARLLAEEGKGAYTFVHDLIREVVADDLGLAQRAELHFQVAGILEQLPEGSRERSAAALADHFAQAGEMARALPYTLQAGDQAATAYAHAEAERQYRAALELARETGEPALEAEALEKRAAALLNLGRWNDGLEVIDTARAAYRALGDVEGEGRTAEGLQRSHFALAAPDAGIALLEPLLEDLRVRGLSPRGQARLYTALAHLLSLSGRLCAREEAFGHLREAVAAGERAMELAQAAGDDGLLAHAMGGWADALSWIGGREQEALDAYEALLPLAEAAGDPWTLCTGLSNAQALRELRGDFDLSQRHIERGLAFVERAVGDPRHPRYAVHMWHNQAELAYYRGDWELAHTAIERSLEIVRAYDLATIFPDAQRLLSQIYLVQGMREAADALLAEPLALVEQRHDFQALRIAYSVLAERDLLDGRAEAVRVYLESLLDRPGFEEPEVLFVLPQLAWAYLELGEEQQAETLAAESRTRAITHRHQLFLVDALRVQAMVRSHQGRWPEAAAALKVSLARCRAMPYPYAEAKALYVYGQLHAAKGELDLAREKYQAALTICDQLREGLYRPHIERAMADLDLPASTP